MIRLCKMGDKCEPIIKRDLVSEVDEITVTMKVVLNAVASIGEELNFYKKLYREISEEIRSAMSALQDGINNQTGLNEVFKNHADTVGRILLSLDQRVTALESISSSAPDPN